MKIRKSSVVAHIGKLSLQVPDLTLYLGPKPKNEDRGENLSIDPNFGIGPVDEILDLPDDYFMRARYDYLTIGRETGFLYLSPKGYNALKPMLQEVFAELEKLSSVYFRPRGTWADFERAVEQFFATVQRATRKRAETFQRKAGEVNQACSAVFDDNGDLADGYA